MENNVTRIVSSEDEALILVDEDDNETGSLSKAECHDGSGILHRAFSVFLFNPAGELLLQQRGENKRLWPSFWSNSCCSHPRVGESIEVAASRRLHDELYATSKLRFVYKFRYQASFDGEGAEHELCHVFLGRIADDPAPNDTEISAIRFIAAADLEREFRESAQSFTPWFRMEWETLNNEYGDVLARYTMPD